MKIFNAVVAMAFASGFVASGCSLMPSGKSEDTAVAAADAAQGELHEGLKVRLSKRGNMDSYVVGGERYRTLKSSDGYSARGVASWYGPNFHGRPTSSGEVYDMYRLTAAHKALPLPTFVRVTHLENGNSVLVKVNDRGPFSGERLIDLSFAAALQLGMVNEGTAMVDIQALSPAELMEISGPDNTLGVDFYREDGVPVFAEQNPEPQGELVTVAAVFSDGDDATKTDVDTDAVLPPPPPAALAETDDILGTPETSLVDAGQRVDVAELLADAKKPAAALPESTGNVYYVQAGVFPSMDAAERAAVDVVLELPDEEVNIKPLKGTEMFRVTVGPVVSSSRASAISDQLKSAGVDNFAVRVKE